jgi:hypothetical protein
MTFLRKDVKEVLDEKNYLVFMSLIESQEIQACLKNGGFIAGGFARALLAKVDIHEYMRTPHTDVDIFFTSVEDAKKAIGSLGKSAQQSFGGFAKDCWTLGYLKIQLVDNESLICSSIEQTLENFDIANCQVAIDGKSFIYPDTWFDLEKSKLLRINKPNTPFLGWRVLKYLESRGYKSIEKSSYPLLIDWLISAALDSFTGFKPKHYESMMKSVSGLLKKGEIEKEEILFFLNKWKINSDGPVYGEVVDWALHLLSGEESDERSKD